MAAAKQLVQRNQITSRLVKQVRYQIQALSQADLGSYTYERSKSHFKDAKADLSVFDPAGKLVLLGRDFGDRTFFWSVNGSDSRLIR